MTVTLREGGAGDSGLAWAIYRRAVLEGAGAHYTEAKRRAWVGAEAEPPWMAERLGTGRCWFAGRAGADEGLLLAAGLARPGPVHLDLFFVLPEARGTGVASALYHAFAAAAGGRGLTAHASLYLRPFLERRGWQVVRPDPTERNGEVLMRFEMERRGAAAADRTLSGGIA